MEEENGGAADPLSRLAGEGQGEGDRGGQMGGVPQTTQQQNPRNPSNPKNPSSDTNLGIM